MEESQINTQNQLNDLLNLLPDQFINLPENKRGLALEIYRRLGKGQPVSLDDLLADKEISLEEAKEFLDSSGGVFYNDDGDIVGFWGIAVQKMAHKIITDHQTVYGWCAWDALFIPQLLGEAATIESLSPTKEIIKLKLSEQGDVLEGSKNIMVSFIEPDAGKMMENVVTNFCHYIFLFKDKSSGEEWVKQHEGTFLLPLQDVINLSKEKNQRQFGNLLKK
ncbi:MAG: organomercurial lyase [Bacteroidetes bacterium]|nr:organomercurial lyase [Bacteroidota bacterium]